MSKRFMLASACAGVLALAPFASAQVVINEFVYDDGGTDDREFIELYNAGAGSVDISGWVVTGRDPSGNNGSFTIAASTFIPAGGFFVLGNTGVANANATIAGGFLENDNETIELRDLTGATVDAVAYETNKGVAFAAPVAAQIGPGVWGNNQANDLAGTPLRATNGLGRFVDGRDINNNGRDFGFRPNTPGTTNNPVNITTYNVPDVSASTVGSDLPGFAYAFVPPRVIDPTVADANNPNAIPPAPTTGNRAIVAWDPSGGGNGVSAAETFNTRAGSFQLKAYLDTRDLPLMSNSAVPPVTFRGSEITIYGIGGTEALMNLTDISGTVGAPDSANGTTGIAWVYEKVGQTTDPGTGDVSEKLYLVDANDGGDAGTGGATPLDWTVLATVDLATLGSAWYDLGISIDAAGNGIANFNGQLFTFVTSPDMHSGAFSVGYRENTQLGADGTPDAILRPATFTIVPEPGTLGLLAIAAPLALRRRRQR